MALRTLQRDSCGRRAATPAVAAVQTQRARPQCMLAGQARAVGHGLRCCPRAPLRRQGLRASAAAASAETIDAAPSTSAAAPSDPATWQPLNGQTAVIVGAGPAGCTMAMHLARAGWQVEVFERRPEPGPARQSRQRSWVLAMYPRGIRPVRAVAAVPLLEERAYKGLVIRPPTPGATPTLLERTGVLMDRTLLATSLLDAARSQYGARVRFTFNAPLTAIDLRSKTATFTPAAETSDAAPAANAASSSGASGSAAALSARYDLLVGADGSGSTLRGLLADAFPGQFETHVLAEGTGCYKSVYGLPPLPEVEAWAPDHATPPALRPRGEFFFFLAGGQGGMMSLCRDIDGHYCGYLAGRRALFEALHSQEDYAAAVLRAAPQMPTAWVPIIAQRLMEAPLSTFPTMRSLSRFWAPGGVVLLGDAAHTVTPSLGQGLNSALQDVELLAEALRGAQGAAAIDAAVRSFSEARAPEIRALQELELLQSAGLTPLRWAEDSPARLAGLLARKWVVAHYSGLALLGTVAATAAAAQRQKKAAAAAAEGRPAAPGGGSSPSMDTAVLDAKYVRSPPMLELLRGHMDYSAMLLRVYGMAALGTACTAGLLYGLWRLLAACGAKVLELLAGVAA